MTKPSGPTFTRHNWPQFQSALTRNASTLTTARLADSLWATLP